MTFYAVTDLETTGLDAQKDVIIEATLVVIDEFGIEQCEPFTSLIHNRDDRYHRAIYRTLYGVDQYVNEMHQKSGLWDDWNNDELPHMTTHNFAAKAVVLLNQFGGPNEIPLFGNSIGSLDRPFIIEHMPGLNEWLSYRNFDVSTLRMLVQDQLPEKQAEWESDIAENHGASTQHRSFDDVKMCIAQYQFYLKALGLVL